MEEWIEKTQASSDLIQPVQLGPYQLTNRIVMAPLNYDDAQVEGWRQVSAAVHAPGGRILSAALACRARVASLAPARRGPAGGAFGDPPGGDIVHHGPLLTLCDAPALATAEIREIVEKCLMQPETPSPPVSMASRSTQQRGT